MTLGGSEQSVVELSRHWAQTGLRVEVIGSIPEAMVCDGVTYRPLGQAETILRADVVVLWRLYGLIGFWKESHRFHCRLLAVDFHDRELFGHEQLLHRSINRIQTLMFKSKFHADYLLSKLPSEQQPPLRERVKVIPNGIRKQQFRLVNPPPREPHRFCYASCYLRGLAPLIQYFWPTVRQLWPDAELHVYYGMDHVRDTATRQRLTRLLQSAGVHDHGRQPVSVISEEKHRSSFHLYYTDSVVETDCISIKESAVAGCIPIIAGVNVFAERSGVVMPGKGSSEQDYRQAAQAFINWVQQMTEPELEKIRQSLREVTTHRDWQETAAQWGRELQLVAPMLSWQEMGTIARQLTTPAGKEPGSKRCDHSSKAKRISSVVYINMASSVERGTSIRRQLLQSCPAELVTRFEAIAGKTHAFTEADRKLFEHCDFKQSRFAASLMGNALSHYRIWERMTSLKEDEVAIVLQDDALLISDFMTHARTVAEELPADALLVFLADHEYAVTSKFTPIDLETQNMETRKSLMKQIVSPHIGKRDDEWMTHCSLAYILTGRGARALLGHANQHGITRHSDHYMKDFLVSQDKNYASIRCLVTSSSDVFKSEVWVA